MTSRRRREIDCSCSQASGPCRCGSGRSSSTTAPAPTVQRWSCPSTPRSASWANRGASSTSSCRTRGDAERGVTRSDEVIRLLEPTLTPLGLEADPEKEDLLAQADEEGAGFISLFTTFGSFSIVAVILLIFLIFVMLAAERRGELGIARAVGTRRSHLVQTYLFEGVAYDLVAAVVGILLGVAVAYGMVFAMGRRSRRSTWSCGST